MKINEIYSFWARLPGADITMRTRRGVAHFDVELLYRVLLEVPWKVRGIMEIGTFLGWSTFWLAAAAEQRDFKMTTVEKSRANSKEARRFLQIAKLDHRVSFLVGDSLKVLPGIPFGEDASPNVWLIDGCHSHKHSMFEALCAKKVIKDGPGLIFFDDVGSVHEEGRKDGGVPRTVRELGARPLPTTLGRMAVLEIGTRLFKE